MPNLQSNPNMDHHQALLVAYSCGAHHFMGIRQALAIRYWDVCAETLQSGSPLELTLRMLNASRVIVQVDCDPANTTVASNLLLKYPRPMLLQMDGVLEYANTFLNPLVELSPVPADLVLASGKHDRSVLRAMGNRASATGLPRLTRFEQRVQSCRVNQNPEGILVATANQPAFTPGARARLIAALNDIKAQAASQSIPIRWRIEREIACELGVQNDRCGLAESLASVTAVLSSASTLVIESMMAGFPTAIIHPHPWPLWIPCAWRYDGTSSEGLSEDVAAIKALDGQDSEPNRVAADSVAKIFAGINPVRTRSIHTLLGELLDPCDELMQAQERIICQYSCRRSAEKVARVIIAASSLDRISEMIDAELPVVTQSSQAMIDAFDALHNNAKADVFVVASRVPSPGLVILAEHRANQIAGFVVVGEPDGATLLGIRAISFAKIDKLVSSGQSILIAPHGDCAMVVASRALRRSGEYVVFDSDSESFEHIDRVVDAAVEMHLTGEVRTTLDDGLIPGAHSLDISQILDGQRPAMLVLKGDEQDFEIYQRSRAWRRDGTLVHSLGWSGLEISSPERFAAVVSGLGNRPYAIYGGGFHTQRLLKYSAICHQPSCILDDRVPCDDTGNHRFEGIDLVHPLSELAGSVETVILSSCVHVSAMWERSAQLRRCGKQVVPLYALREHIEDRLS